MAYHDDWQSSKKTVLERNAYMFDNELMSDVSFKCGESSRIFHAHKYVLATSSSVFFAMFYGGLAKKRAEEDESRSPICLPATDDESFEEFLRYLYIEDCKITAENAIGVFDLANMYNMASLKEKCRKVLKSSIKPDIVFMMIEQAKRYDERELQKKCWEVVQIKTRECLNSEAFCNVESTTVFTLLIHDTLTITEVELFKAVLKWADAECSRLGVDVEKDKTARRTVLNMGIVYGIRFLSMSLEDFKKYVPHTEILTETEVTSILQAFNGIDVPDLNWKNRTKRKPYIDATISRFDVHNIHAGQLNYDGNDDDDVLSLTVSKAVLLRGVRLFGDANGGQYEVTLTAHVWNVTGTYTSDQDDDGVWGYDVMLDDAVPISPGQQVIISARITGPTSYGGRNGKATVNANGVVVTFSDSRTSKTCGQFHKLFLSNAPYLSYLVPYV